MGKIKFLEPPEGGNFLELSYEMKSQLVLYENEAHKIFYRLAIESAKSELMQQFGANFKFFRLTKICHFFLFFSHTSLGVA